MSYDITEEFQIDLSAATPATNTLNDGVVYDVSFNNLGFFAANSPETIYRRQTAQYRKDQSDNSSEPGEQSLSGWWLRSQSSFHLGAGIKFYEPTQEAGSAAANQTVRFRFDTSEGVDIWTAGEVSLLPASTQGHMVTGSTHTSLQSITSEAGDAVLMLDGYDVDKIDATGAVVHFVDYVSGTDYPVQAICNDGVYAYWLTDVMSGTKRARLYKKLLVNDSGDADTQFYTSGPDEVANARMEWVKERIILCMNNKIYEMVPGASDTTAWPDAIYTSPSADIKFTGITSSGSDIFVSAHNGLNSFIMRLALDTDGGVVPTLSGAVVAAEMPRGEKIHTIKYYLGYMLIGTEYGVRVAQVTDAGDIIYGPLIFKSDQPVYQFAVDDHFAWCTARVNGKLGLKRIDLSTQIDTLVFPWANDRLVDTVTAQTTGVAFLGDSDKLAYSGAANYVYVDSADLRSTGYLTTGFVRYNTLENKIFKYVTDRALYSNNSLLSIDVIEKDLTSTSVSTKVKTSGNSESILPSTAAEFIKLKFTLQRDTVDATKGTTFYGYQIKALPASPRQRLIQYPLFCFDTEMDRFNNKIGYTGQANERLLAIEQLEAAGDFVKVTDYRSGETYNGLIEEVSYMGTTPPDRRFNGVGGMLTVTVRKI